MKNYILVYLAADEYTPKDMTRLTNLPGVESLTGIAKNVVLLRADPAVLEDLHTMPGWVVCQEIPKPAAAPHTSDNLTPGSPIPSAHWLLGKPVWPSAVARNATEAADYLLLAFLPPKNGETVLAGFSRNIVRAGLIRVFDAFEALGRPALVLNVLDVLGSFDMMTGLYDMLPEGRAKAQLALFLAAYVGKDEGSRYSDAVLPFCDAVLTALGTPVSSWLTAREPA